LRPSHRCSSNTWRLSESIHGCEIASELRHRNPRLPTGSRLSGRTVSGNSWNHHAKHDESERDSQVAFGLYSSSQYIQFKSTYSCLYSSNQPDYNTLRCPVSGSGSSYRFDYTVSQNLSSQIETIFADRNHLDHRCNQDVLLALRSCRILFVLALSMLVTKL
jgi:hypothetical protein